MFIPRKRNIGKINLPQRQVQLGKLISTHLHSAGDIKNQKIRSDYFLLTISSVSVAIISS